MNTKAVGMMAMDIHNVRASMIGPDLSVRFLDKKLTLGTWQQIVFVELDTSPRDRTVIVQLIGE